MPVKRIKPKREEVPAEVKSETTDENKLDPQEEKILDWILKAVVVFVLGWLGLAIIMVIGGFFHLWG